MELCFHTCLFFEIIIFLLILLTNTYVEANEYDDCKSSFLCGNVSLSYPFYDDQNRPAYCGHPGFKIYCSDEHNMPEISVSTDSSEIYYLLRISPESHTISVAREYNWNAFCPATLSETTLNFNLFNYTSAAENVTLYYECSASFPVAGYPFSCTTSSNGTVYFMTRNSGNIPPDICKRNISISVYQSVAANITDISSLQAAFRGGFELEWIANNERCDDCRASGGECGYNTSLGRFACYCTDDTHDARCDGSYNQRYKLKITLLVIASSVVGLTMIAVALLYFTRRMGFQKLNVLFKKERKNSKDVEAVLKRYGDNAPKRYTYKEIKKMTSCFKEKLGEGGYGAVYKGKLQNGSSIAVTVSKDQTEL